MPEGREDAERTLGTHSLLLSLAGLLDDELLGWCRELVAVGEGDYALELITAAVQADRVRLPAAPHDQLLAAASRRGLLGRGETLPAPDPSPKMRHRFLADPLAAGFPVLTGPRSPEHALAAVPPRLLRDCQLWLTWRCTPAGSAPGPLPHPVLLIEADEADGADVLAYQVGEVLLRAGVFASVEVFAPDIELGDYHRAALADARHLDLAADSPESTGATRRIGTALPQPGGNGVEPRPRDVARRPQPPRPGPLAGTEDTGAEGRPPLHPVDRVIAARSAGPRRPRPENVDRADSGFDEIAAGLTFDRPAPAVEPELFGPDAPDGPGSTPRNGAAERPSGERRPPAPGGPPGPARPAPPPNAERPGPPRPAPPPGGGPGKRPPGRPADRPSEDPLSEVEQRLLRQLHEELAAREDETTTGPDGPRIFPGGNGARKPRPNRPNDPPPAG